MLSSKDVFSKLEIYYHEQKLAHAYLIETNNQEKCLDDLCDFLKIVFCPTDYKDKCDNCNICHLIAKKEMPDLYIVYPDGKEIKKEQIINLKNNCSVYSDLTKKKIYIIMNAELLNKASENAMLKFIEEPFDSCYGFFITNSKESLLLTIQSRCEVLNIIYKEDFFSSLNLNSIQKDAYLEIINKYLEKLESKKGDIRINKELIQSLPNKEDIVIFFKIINYIYNNKLKEFSIGFSDEFAYLNGNDEQMLIKKIKIISEILSKIHYNLNMDLLLDRFFIEMSDING